jgi:ribosome-associated heat shock protein Hsp15
VKPAKEVRPGDTIQVTMRSEKRTVNVAGIADRRGPAAVAAALYVETPESIREREQARLERQAGTAASPGFGERPTKRDRRRLDALRRARRKRP